MQLLQKLQLKKQQLLKRLPMRKPQELQQSKQLHNKQ